MEHISISTSSVPERRVASIVSMRGVTPLASLRLASIRLASLRLASLRRDELLLI